MTVNAIAKELGKKVLMVDFNGLMNKKDSSAGDFEVDLKGLFRESMMSNAVLFFDECENIFKSRNLGNDKVLNSLLTEIERHEGIVFLATNRPYEIDEAMHRRITMVLEYNPPDSKMRKKIWESLLFQNGRVTNDHSNGENNDSKKENESSTQTIVKNGDLTSPEVFSFSSMKESVVNHKNTKGLRLDGSVDTSFLAVKYALTGGFIKNAVLSALLEALSRSKDDPIISQEDLIKGCQLQLRGHITQRGKEAAFLGPGGSLEKLFLSADVKRNVLKIIRHEQARTKVYGSWTDSVDEDNREVACEQKASINLLAGTRGSGKTTLAKCIANELHQKRIRYLHLADYLLGASSQYEVIAIIRQLVQDARIMDALIVVDGFEHIIEDHGDGSSGAKMHLLLSRVMDILYEYHGLVILICHIDNPQNMSLQREFATRLFSFIRFNIPPHEIRSMLWKSLMPVLAPRKKGINYEALGRKFEINAGTIRAAVVCAASEAAMKPDTSYEITQEDLMKAGEQEMEKLRGGNFDLISKLFA